MMSRFIDNLLKKMHISHEGKSVLMAGSVLSLVFFIWVPSLAVYGFLLLIFMMSFFRDPVRQIPDNPQVVVSPADGRISDIDVVRFDAFGDIPVRRIGIFLSVFDAHVQRYPFSGIIEEVQYRKGRFYAAFSEKASQCNESNTVVIGTDHGPFAVRQIAGFIARRIVCHAKPEKEVVKGARLGIIMFGSRVELYIPEHIDLTAHVGDRVKAGETILGVIS